MPRGLAPRCVPLAVLALDDIRHDGGKAFLIVNASHAATTRPHAPTVQPRLHVARGVQRPCAPRLELRHDRFRRDIRGRHYHVYVGGTALHRMQRPPTNRRMLGDRLLHSLPLRHTQASRRTDHRSLCGTCKPRRRGVHAAGAVRPPTGITRQPRAIRGPREEEGERIGTERTLVTRLHAVKYTHEQYLVKGWGGVGCPRLPPRDPVACA